MAKHARKKRRKDLWRNGGPGCGRKKNRKKQAKQSTGKHLAGCTGKRGYPTVIDARIVAQERAVANGGKLFLYICRHCSLYHISRSKGHGTIAEVTAKGMVVL